MWLLRLTFCNVQQITQETGDPIYSWCCVEGKLNRLLSDLHQITFYEGNIEGLLVWDIERTKDEQLKWGGI
jgi:hypothetical protein